MSLTFRKLARLHRKRKRLQLLLKSKTNKNYNKRSPKTDLRLLGIVLFALFICCIE